MQRRLKMALFNIKLVFEFDKKFIAKKRFFIDIEADNRHGRRQARKIGMWHTEAHPQPAGWSARMITVFG